MSKMLDTALRDAEVGLSVIPIKANGTKHPPDPKTISREQFFAALFLQEARFIELRSLPSEHRIFVKLGNVGEIERFTKKHAKENIYFGVAERMDANKGGGKNNCGLACAVFCDFDFKGKSEKEARKSIHDFSL